MRLRLLVCALLVTGCAPRDTRTEIVVQRFFGECGAIYGKSRDIARADTECGILTTLFNRFEAENPDIRLKLNVVAWPGYAQLAAQIAAGDTPDLVTMHQSVISDYQGRGLLEPNRPDSGLPALRRERCVRGAAAPPGHRRTRPHRAPVAGLCPPAKRYPGPDR